MALDAFLKTHEQTALKQWPLQWESIANNNSSWRKDVVTNLYPRFLYMFSDVVCYATKNARCVTLLICFRHADCVARTTTADLTNLVNWAKTGYDHTTNQLSRPALFIVVNNDGRENMTQWCDVDFATEAVLQNLDSSPWYDEQRATWSRRGREVASARELLLCYYDSLRVVFIPSGSAVSAGTIFEQYQKLYQEIQTSAMNVQRRRQSSGIHSDVETLTLHTEIAFQALSENLEGMVDFHDITQQVSRLPESFTEHLINTLVRLRKSYDGWERVLLKDIVPYLAATLCLEVADWGESLFPKELWNSAMLIFSRFQQRKGKSSHPDVSQGIPRFP